MWTSPQFSGWRRRPWTVHAQLQQEEKAGRNHKTSENGQASPQNGKTVGHQLQRVHQSSSTQPAEQVNHNGAAPQDTTGAPTGFWENLPSRYKLVFACAVAFVICNMVSLIKDKRQLLAFYNRDHVQTCCVLLQDKVNISVAIIYMSRDFGWSPTVSGIVQSSFFAGYMCTQIPGGYVVSKLGGRKVLPTGVSMWSAATAATPLLAGSLPGKTLLVDLWQTACNPLRSGALVVHLPIPGKVGSFQPVRNQHSDRGAVHSASSSVRVDSSGSDGHNASVPQQDP